MREAADGYGVDYNQNDWLPEIRTILMEELDMPRELVYLQIVAGEPTSC